VQLAEEPAAAALDLPVAFVGFDIPDDFVVGYGMDYAERYRNLRGIHRLVFEADNDGAGAQKPPPQRG
jgi:hypoxanthine phosphoribosyltransferase